MTINLKIFKTRSLWQISLVLYLIRLMVENLIEKPSESRKKWNIRKIFEG